MEKQEKKLLEIFRSLNLEDKNAVLNFAGFLYEKNSPEKNNSDMQPLEIMPPPEESVIAAMKRLKKTYPMIDSLTVFDQASTLLSAHLLQGRDKKEIIDELEKLFLDTFHSCKK